jgi:hypothetical protein
MSEPKWPAVPGWAFRVADVVPAGNIPAATLPPRPDTRSWRTHELIVSFGHDGTALRFGKRFLSIRNGRLQLSQGKAIGSPLVTFDDVHDVAFVRGAKDTSVYFDGALFTTYQGAGPVGKIGDGPALAGMHAQAGYTKALGPAQILKNAQAARRYGRAAFLSDTETVTLDAELIAFTPVPDPARIKPYRNALLAHEYRVLSLKEGRTKALKPGAKVRVFRYGVWDGKRTGIESLIPGDKVRMTIKPLSSDPVLEREYQIDDLNIDVSATYYVEAPHAVKAP